MAVAGTLTIPEAERLARTLMDAHNLTGWRLRFNRSIRTLGSCDLFRRTITLSAAYVEHNSADVVRDTILHEIAHAWAPGDGHGPKWKAKARELGATPKACADGRVVAQPPGRWQATCGHCGRNFSMARRPQRPRACRCTGHMPWSTRPVLHFADTGAAAPTVPVRVPVAAQEGPRAVRAASTAPKSGTALCEACGERHPRSSFPTRVVKGETVRDYRECRKARNARLGRTP